MSNYNISKLILKEVIYNFKKPEIKELTISIKDNIEIVNVFENQAVLEVKRTLCFDSQCVSYVSVCYEVIVEHDGSITNDILSQALKNRTINLITIYSKMSLLISQITNMSPIGTIVTPPNFNIEKIEIK